MKHKIQTACGSEHVLTLAVLMDRRYALLFQRQVHRKVKVSRSFNSAPASRSSYSAEASIPALTDTLSCKANASTNLARFLTLSAEIQWKASQKQNQKQATHYTSGNKQQRQGRPRRQNSFNKALSGSAVIDDGDVADAYINTGQTLRYSDPFAAQRKRLPIPEPVYARKEKHEFSKPSQGRKPNLWQTKVESQDDEEEKEGQMPGGRSQCMLQVRSTPGGELPDYRLASLCTTVLMSSQQLLASIAFTCSVYDANPKHFFVKS